MKRLILCLGLMMALIYGVKAQKMSIMDLYSAKSSTDIDVIHNYLVNNKRFQYSNKFVLNRTKEGWLPTIYIFKYGKNEARVKISSNPYSSGSKILSEIEYKIYDTSEFNYLKRTFESSSFFIESSFTDKEGYRILIYAKKNGFKMFSVTDKGDHKIVLVQM